MPQPKPPVQQTADLFFANSEPPEISLGWTDMTSVSKRKRETSSEFSQKPISKMRVRYPIVPTFSQTVPSASAEEIDSKLVRGSRTIGQISKNWNLSHMKLENFLRCFSTGNSATNLLLIVHFAFAASEDTDDQGPVDNNTSTIFAWGTNQSQL